MKIDLFFYLYSPFCASIVDVDGGMYSTQERVWSFTKDVMFVFFAVFVCHGQVSKIDFGLWLQIKSNEFCGNLDL